jgi:hypothetical protein
MRSGSLTARWRQKGPATGPRHAKDPIMMHFYGALPMAVLTVGAGTCRWATEHDRLARRGRPDCAVVCGHRFTVSYCVVVLT